MEMTPNVMAEDFDVEGEEEEEDIVEEQVGLACVGLGGGRTG